MLLHSVAVGGSDALCMLEFGRILLRSVLKMYFAVLQLVLDGGQGP